MKHTIAHSQIHFSKLMSASHSHPAGRVYAGEIMQLMYNAAHKVASRHAGTDVTAVRVDEMVFLNPIQVGTVISCHAFLTHVGRTSMEVEVNLYLEGLSATKPALSAFFVMIALDENQRPTPVPGLELTNETERLRFKEGRQRYNQHRNSSL
ncbi:hypothetical protein SCACP_28970 [Sporomusa carbonis]|uniref:acyl-CoA thioesterase n=1 Tax=Sporomusa carbonis TaxID=3076075 RepID=UPI003A60C1A7